MDTSKPLTQRQQGFLDAYQVTGQVKPAAARAGCSRELHYGALRTSETYREEFSLVQQRLAAELEDELWQRAVYGVKIPKFYRGEVIGYEIRYSDTLLMTLLEARDPEKFGGIREELQRQSREDGIGVRWDREEVGRPTLPRMTGPMPPAPPRPPRPPVPNISECGEPVTYAEWAAARGITGAANCGPVDEEKLKRWAAGENLGSVEWVPEEAAADFECDDVDADVLEEAELKTDGPGSLDRDADFCVRWSFEEESGGGSAAEEPAGGPRGGRSGAAERRATFVRALGRTRQSEERPGGATGLSVFVSGGGRVRRMSGGDRSRAGRSVQRRVARMVGPLENGGGHSPPYISRAPPIGVAAPLVQPVVPRRPGPGRSSGPAERWRMAGR